MNINMPIKEVMHLVPSARLNRILQSRYSAVVTNMTFRQMDERLKEIASLPVAIDRLEETTLGSRDILGSNGLHLSLEKMDRGILIKVIDPKTNEWSRSDILGPKVGDGIYPWGRAGCLMGALVEEGKSFQAAFQTASKELGDTFYAPYCDCAQELELSMLKAYIWSPGNYSTDQFSTNKILNHAGAVDSYLRGENPAPVTLEIDPTNECQSHCPECTFKERDKALKLNAEMVIRVIEEVRSAGGAKGITWTGGGEPVMHPKLNMMMRRAFDLGAENGLITNGMGLGQPELLEEILPLLRWIRISLDSGSPETYALTHGINARNFERILDNLRVMIALRKEKNIPISIGISFLTSARTKHDMLKAAAIAKGLGVDYIQFKPMQIHMDTWTYGYEDQSFVKDMLAEFKAMETPDFRVFAPKNEFYGGEMWEPKPCHGQQFSTSIAADGSLYMCCHFKGNPRFRLGDLRQMSFLDIWNSAERKRMIKELDLQRCVPWCKEYQINDLVEEIVRSGKLVRGPVKYNDGWMTTYAEGKDFPPVLHHNFL